MEIPLFFRNLLSIYSANLVNGFIGIAAIPLVISALGKEQYGIFSVYTVLASYIALVDCGVTKHFVRLIAADRSTDNQATCLQKALGWYLSLASILIIALPGIIFIVVRYIFPVSLKYQNDLRIIVILSVIEFCLTIPIMMSQTLTVSNEGFRQLSVFNVVTGIYRYGLMILAAFVFKTPSMVVAFLVFRRLLDVLFAKILLQWPEKIAWRPKVSFREFKGILAKSSILSTAQFIQTTIVAIGSVLVNRSFGTLVLGNYRAAFDLGSKVWFLSNGIGLMLFPRFSSMLADKLDRRKIARKIYNILGKSWVLYMILSLIGILSAKFVLQMINLDAEQITIFFVILFAGICINAHSNVSYEFLLADGQYGAVAKLSLCSLLLLYIIFVMLKGIAGPYAVAWAWLGSQSVYALFADELVIAVSRNNSDSKRAKLLLGKLSMLMLMLCCLVTEIYHSGIFSMSIAIAGILTGLIYLLPNINIYKSISK